MVLMAQLAETLTAISQPTSLTRKNGLRILSFQKLFKLDNDNNKTINNAPTNPNNLIVKRDMCTRSAPGGNWTY